MIILTAIQAFLVALETMIFGSLISLVVLIVRVPGIQNTAYQISRIYSYLVLKTCFVRLRVTGLEKIDQEKPYVFMSNHSSYFDIPAEAVAIKHQMRWVYKKELDSVPFLGWALRSIGHVMVDRSDRRQAVESLKKSLARIEGNTSIMIYPEGTRSRTGEFLPFKKGGFHMALLSGFPIVPVAITGSRDIMKPGIFRINPGTIEVRVFSPIDTGPYGFSRVGELIKDVREVIEKGLENRMD